MYERSAFKQSSIRRFGIGALVGFLCLGSITACSRRRQAGTGGDATRKLVWRADASADSVPISLTASDGTGLRLLGIDAKAVVQEPLAFTELHLKFKNPEGREREGRFEITLPPGAAVSRFAMKIGGIWQEAEVVERQKARETYEDFLHRRQDPALLEKKAGNQFSARVFPIPPYSEKELIISYSQELLKAPYTLLLAGLPEVEELRARVNCQLSSERSSRYEIAKKRYTPTGNLVLDDSSRNRPSAHWIGLRNSDLAVVKVTPQFNVERSSVRSMIVLFDTSASRALNFSKQLEKIADVLKDIKKEIGDDFELQFVCFDQEIFPAYKGALSGFGESPRKQILERAALGASDLEGALHWVKENISGSDRLLIVSDGIVTAKESARRELQQMVKALSKNGVKRVDVVADGGIRDELLLRDLVNAGTAQAGIVADGSLSVSEIAKKITRTTIETIPVKVPDATWVWPNELKGVQSGDAFLVYVGAAANVPLRIELQGVTPEPVTIKPRPVARPLLERSSAIAQIEMVTGRLGSMKEGEEKAALRQQVVDLSIAHRVLSDFTALLVLETERDYARFNIDRNALTDILVVGEKGVDLMHRETPLQQTGTRQRMVKSGSADEKERPAPARRGEEGQMGKRDARKAGNHYGIRGPRDNADPHMARARTTGEFLRAPSRGGFPDTAQGDGNFGEGSIGLGNLNTIGHGGGGGSGSGYGRGAGGLGGRRGGIPRIRQGAPEVRGALSREIIRRIVRRHINEVKYCYERELAERPDLRGRVSVKFIISGTGAVQMAAVAESTLRNSNVENCMAQAVRRWTFPQPDGGGIVIVTYPFVLNADSTGEVHPSDAQQEEPAGDARQPTDDLPPLFTRTDSSASRQNLANIARQTAYEGTLQEVMALIAAGNPLKALKEATAWRARAPGELLALVALGEAFEAEGNLPRAARAYGSIIDLYPSRADMRRMAGERLERLGDTAHALVVDTYRTAVAQRPDHPASHRLYAWALFGKGEYEAALTAMAKGVEREYPSGRFAGVVAAMREEMGLIAAAWKRHAPEKEKRILEEIAERGIRLPDKSSTRFVLHWESDANDVDLHVYDENGNHVFYESKRMPTGGRLVADVTTGYGPEYFTIEGTPKAFPYTLQAHYYSRGPMGYGMGTLQIIVHDGKGGITLSHRPYIVMKDGAFVGLGIHENLQK